MTLPAGAGGGHDDRDPSTWSPGYLALAHRDPHLVTAEQAERALLRHLPWLQTVLGADAAQQWLEGLLAGIPQRVPAARVTPVGERAGCPGVARGAPWSVELTGPQQSLAGVLHAAAHLLATAGGKHEQGEHHGPRWTEQYRRLLHAFDQLSPPPPQSSAAAVFDRAHHQALARVETATGRRTVVGAAATPQPGEAPEMAEIRAAITGLAPPSTQHPATTAHAPPAPQPAARRAAALTPPSHGPRPERTAPRGAESTAPRPPGQHPATVKPRGIARG